MLGAAISGSKTSTSMPLASPSSGLPAAHASTDQAAPEDSDASGEDASSDDDVPAQTGGFMASIKAFVPLDKQPAAPKASAKAAAKAPARVSKSSNSSGGGVGKAFPNSKAAPKVSLVNQGKRRKVGEDLNNAGGLEPPMSSELSEADLQLVTDFKVRLAEAKKLEPPVADGPFKSYLSDTQATLTTLRNELKTKRRSALRRAEKDLDPLYVSLGEMITDADSFSHLIKCFLTYDLRLHLNSICFL